jgi:hypothetical protein
MGDKIYTKKEAVAFCNKRHAKQVAKRKEARAAKKTAAGTTAKPKRVPKGAGMSLSEAKDWYAMGRVEGDKADVAKGSAAMKRHGVLPSKYIKTQEYLNLVVQAYTHKPSTRSSRAFAQDAKTAMGFGSHYAGTVFDVAKPAKKPRKKKTE